MTYNELITHFGSPSNVRRAIQAYGDDITTASIAGWKRSGLVPSGRQYQFQLITGGKLKAEPAQKTRAACA